MTFARTIAVLTVSLMSIHCSDGGGVENVPPGTENAYSLLFDGVDDYGSAGDISITLSSPIEAFSISVWFKAAGVPEAESTMIHLNPELESGVNSMQVRLYWQSATEVAFHITPDFGAVPGATLVTDVANPQTWNHLMLTFNSQAASGNAKMYLNGAEVDSGDQGTSLAAIGNIQFAKFAREDAESYFYKGSLDEVAFWDTTLTSAETSSVYNLGVPKDVQSDFDDYTSSGALRSFWRMGDDNFGTGANVSDLISGNHSTIVGGGVFQTDTP